MASLQKCQIRDYLCSADFCSLLIGGHRGGLGGWGGEGFRKWGGGGGVDSSIYLVTGF